MCRNTSEYRSVCISNDLQSSTPRIAAIPNSMRTRIVQPASGDCKCPSTRTKENTHHQLLQESDSTARGNGCTHWSWPFKIDCQLGPSCTHPPKRGRRMKGLSHTQGQPYNTKKKDQKKTRLTNTKKSKPSIIIGCMQIWKTMSKLMYSTL